VAVQKNEEDGKVPRERDEIAVAVLTAYLARRSATARAMDERKDLMQEPSQLLWYSRLKEAADRDARMLEWLKEGAEEAVRCRYAIRVLIAWLLEHLSGTQPHRVLDLLKFDMHYLHVLQFSMVLEESRPVGVDPMSLEKRKAFRDGLAKVFWRPRTTHTKFPEPVEFLKIYESIKRRLQSQCESPQKSQKIRKEGYNDPTETLIKEVMSYRSKDLEKLVRRAHLEDFVLPGHLDDAYERSLERDPGDCPAEQLVPYERLVGELDNIALFVEADNHHQAALLVIGSLVSPGAQEPGDVARKYIEKAKKLLPPGSEAMREDHRYWSSLDSAPVVKIAGALALSGNAQLEGIKAEHVEALQSGIQNAD